MLRTGSISSGAQRLAALACVLVAALLLPLAVLPAMASAKSAHSSAASAKSKGKSKKKKKPKPKHKKRKPTAIKATPAPNSGLPGSACVGEPYTGGGVPAADSRLDRSSLGPDAPADYEIGKPTDLGSLFSSAPKRVMIVIHGGGWYLVGDETVRALDSAANSWRAVGWETVNIDYRACGLSVADAIKFFDLVRNKVGPRVPICITGQSAGAHLALMIAAARQDVACVIGEGTPTDFSTIIAQGNAEAANGSAVASLKAGSRWAYGIARAAFGLGGLDAVSPINFASSIKARVLLGTSAGDGFVPYQQAEELASAIHAADPSRYVDVDRLASGSVTWVHAPVSSGANADFNARVAALVRPYGSAPGQAVFGLPGLFNLGFHFG